MNEASLNAQKRRQFGKQAAKTLRRQGKLPAVAYGRDQETVPLELDYREFEMFIRKSHGESMIIDLQIEGGDKPWKTILKDVQRDPVRNHLLHADFQKISMTELLTATAPLMLIGQAAGTSEGGILEQTLRELSIRCLPADMPEHLDIDISALNVGDSIHVRELDFPNIEIMTDGDVVVASVLMPKAGVEEEAPEEALEEPEVIGQAQEETDGEGESESS